MKKSILKHFFMSFKRHFLFIFDNKKLTPTLVTFVMLLVPNTSHAVDVNLIYNLCTSSEEVKETACTSLIAGVSSGFNVGVLSTAKKHFINQKPLNEVLNQFLGFCHQAYLNADVGSKKTLVINMLNKIKSLNNEASSELFSFDFAPFYSFYFVPNAFPLNHPDCAG